MTVHYSGCCVHPAVEWYAAGYNSVSHRLLNSQFGKDIFAECGSPWRRP